MARHKDPVTREVFETVMNRDVDYVLCSGMASSMRTVCLAPVLDPTQSGMCSGPSTLDHVKDHPMMGRRAPSDPAHLVTLCYWHHIESGWATGHRPLLRWYLKRMSEPVSA